MTKLLVAITIMVAFVLLVILVLNMEEKSKIIRIGFVSFISVFLISVFFINEIVMDYLLSIIIRFYYFPTFSSIILIIFITASMFLYNLKSVHLEDKYRITNFIFAFLIIIGYVIFMIMNVDVNSYNELYNGTSLKCLRYISRTFILWMIVLASIKYYKYFFRR